MSISDPRPPRRRLPNRTGKIVSAQVNMLRQYFLIWARSLLLAGAHGFAASSSVAICLLSYHSRNLMGNFKFSRLIRNTKNRRSCCRGGGIQRRFRAPRTLAPPAAMKDRGAMIPSKGNPALGAS